MNISIQAKTLELALFCGGLCTHRDYMAWAENIIVKGNEPAFELIEIAASVNTKEILDPLKVLSKGSDPFTAIRPVLGRMYYIASSNLEVLQHYAYFLYQFAGLNNYMLPRELNFFLSHYDDYALASQEICIINKINNEFLKDLSGFKTPNSALDNWYF